MDRGVLRNLSTSFYWGRFNPSPNFSWLFLFPTQMLAHGTEVKQHTDVIHRCFNNYGELQMEKLWQLIFVSCSECVISFIHVKRFQIERLLNCFHWFIRSNFSEISFYTHKFFFLTIMFQFIEQKSKRIELKIITIIKSVLALWPWTACRELVPITVVMDFTHAF